MIKKIYLISWYFPSFPGGAEKSILEELKKYKKNGFDPFVISFDEKYSFGKFEIEGICGINYKLKYFVNLSRYWTYLLNRKYIYTILNNKFNFNSNDLILTQSIMAPIFGKFCMKNKLEFIYYLRDENNLNEFHNYWVGFNSFFKVIKDLIDFIPLYYYKNLNILILKNSNKIISNSKFISNILMKKFNLNSEIILPVINSSKFKNVVLNKNEQKYITFIGGDNSMKGYDIVLKIAKRMPNKHFLIIGNYSEKKYVGNITYIPWQKNILNVYKQTKILIVPSRWQEAYGRIVIEANHLKIIVISSGRGGLPESNLDGIIIDDLENIDLWIKKINLVN